MNSVAALFPLAVAWAENQSALILEEGRTLRPEEMETAKRVGVQYPERVRILEVAGLPQPDDKRLQESAQTLGLLGPTMVGLTLGYGIYLVEGSDPRFLAHELRHVQQYERLGSIAKFLTIYLQQLATYGYARAPLELDASKHETA